MIISVSGKARAGKDEVGKALIEKGFMRIAFADALKDGVAAVFGLTHEQLYGDLKDEVDEFWQDTTRNILQKFGTECLRKGYRDDIWIKCVERAIKMHPGNWVITDARFPNEIEAIKSWGGFTLLVHRPGYESELSSDAKQHASETALDGYNDWDGIIFNEGTIEDLHHNAWEMICHLTNPEIKGGDKIKLKEFRHG
jgi:hypothetical protein